MKKILTKTISAIILLAAPVLSAHADVSERVTIEEAIGKRNIVVIHPDDEQRYLLHLKTGCDVPQVGQSMMLTVRGPLDAHDDSVKMDAYHYCDIDQANPITQRLDISYVSASNTEAKAKDESGREFYISYGPACRAIQGYNHQSIYVFQGGDQVEKSDRLILPNKDGQCSILYLREIDAVDSEAEEEIVGQLPTAVTHVRAIPKNGAVFLTWRAAQDDTGIARYLVSYSNYPVNSKNVPAEDMPNLTESASNYITINDLENERDYYFYVIAVDEDGNTGSDWSTVAKATPRGSIFSATPEPSGGHTLDIRIASESARSVLLEWNPHPLANRYSVVLLVDGKRDLAITEHPSSSIRILKADERKGKSLRLEVRAYSLRGFLLKEDFEFEF